MAHKYPKDLVFELLELWRQRGDLGGATEERDRPSFGRLPEFEVLEDLISTCYQVSQMQEEARGVRFRLLLCDPTDVNPDENGARQGLFTLLFTEPRPFNEYELLKLGPSIDYNNSLIGLHYRRSEGLQIWGLIHSGSKWTQVIHGGSKKAAPLPPALGVNVVGSGRLILCRGLEILAQLSGGTIIQPSINVFRSEWMAQRFSRLQSEILTLHQENSSRQGSWARIDPELVGVLYLEFFKHLISTVRRSGHGGTVISFPAGMENLVAHDNPYIDLRYRFQDGAAKVQLKTIILEILETVSRVCGERYGSGYVAGWQDYASLHNEELAKLDERVFKYARFMARLTGVDGAVVASEGLEIIGFGGIIQGTMEMGSYVARAVDPDGTKRLVEKVESVGTRHRSLYHLCNRLHDVVGIVVSQDAKARLVTWNRDIVTCWDVIPIDFT